MVASTKGVTNVFVCGGGTPRLINGGTFSIKWDKRNPLE